MRLWPKYEQFIGFICKPYLRCFLLYALWFVNIFFFSYALRVKQMSCFGSRNDVCQKTGKTQILNSTFGLEAGELFLCCFPLRDIYFNFVVELCRVCKFPLSVAFTPRAVETGWELLKPTSLVKAASCRATDLETGKKQPSQGHSFEKNCIWWSLT